MCALGQMWLVPKGPVLCGMRGVRASRVSAASRNMGSGGTESWRAFKLTWEGFQLHVVFSFFWFNRRSFSVLLLIGQRMIFFFPL